MDRGLAEMGSQNVEMLTSYAYYSVIEENIMYQKDLLRGFKQ